MTETKVKPAEQDFLATVGEAFKLIKASWEALLLNLLTFVLVAIIPALVIGLTIPLLIIPIFVNGGSWVVAVLLFIFIMLAAIVLACLFIPAMVVAQLASVKGEKIEFDAAFKKGTQYVVRYIGLAVLVGLSVVIGTILFVVPGILAAFFFSMSFYILVDKNTGVIDSMKQSYELVKQNWMWVLALFIVNMAVSITNYVPIIGSIASMVLSIAYFCLPAIIYLKINKK